MKKTNSLQKEDVNKKFKAIEFLVKNGSRNTEWQEAGLLDAIEKILDGHGISSKDLQKLMDEAKEY